MTCAVGHSAEHEARQILRAARVELADTMTLEEAGDRVLALAARIRYQRAYRDGHLAAVRDMETETNAAVGRAGAPGENSPAQ